MHVEVGGLKCASFFMIEDEKKDANYPFGSSVIGEPPILDLRNQHLRWHLPLLLFRMLRQRSKVVIISYLMNGFIVP